MEFVDVDGLTFVCPVAFHGVVTFPDRPEGISLDDLVSLTGTGTFQAAGPAAGPAAAGDLGKSHGPKESQPYVSLHFSR
jgi:hypothetical protein